MKFEWKLIMGSSLFLGILYALYWFTSYEDAGSVMLLFGGCAYLMLGAFLLLQWRRRMSIPRPEDNPVAEQSDGEGEVGFFPSASLWPAGIGLGAIFVVLALVWGTWYLAIGIPLVLGSIIGFSVEAEIGIEDMADIEERYGSGAHGAAAHDIEGHAAAAPELPEVTH